VLNDTASSATATPSTATSRDLLDFSGKVAVVTGAASGLGLVFATALARAGAEVVLADIDEARVMAAADRLATQLATGENATPAGRVSGWRVDVSDEASTQALARAAAASTGRIDILVNNAAIYATLKRQPFHEIDVAEWDRVMAVNLKGPFLMARAVFPHMRRASSAEGGAGQGGQIVNISSATVMSGSPLWSHYVASKGGVIALTRSLARELGDEGINVNALAPGFTLTEASLGLMADAASYGVARGAIKRGAQPEDMVGAMLYLASPLSAFVTGQTLVVDGGRQFI
jgi:NAD(P)-dependent dehydrogenase (short-subunit alcohol dehydrogenase family)